MIGSDAMAPLKHQYFLIATQYYMAGRFSVFAGLMVVLNGYMAAYRSRMRTCGTNSDPLTDIPHINFGYEFLWFPRGE